MHFKSKTVSRELPKDQSGLGIALCLKRPASAISAAAFKSKSLRNSLIHRICLQINKECHKLEKKSLLKKTAVRDLKHFQWNAVLKEWMKEAPTFYKVLKSIAMPPTISRNQRKKQLLKPIIGWLVQYCSRDAIQGYLLCNILLAFHCFLGEHEER